jgi:WD40 repeat protein
MLKRPTADNGLPDDDSSRLEEIVERFERAWLSGPRPDIEAYLPADPVLRRAVLIELVHTDLECRLKSGEEASAEEYLQRYPDLAEDPSVALPLRALAERFRPSPGPGPGSDVPSAGSGPAEPLLPSFPGYDVLGELGRGGMGVVYKARQRALERFVAVKVLLAEEDDALDRRARFRREAEAVARLRHPNIVQVYGVGEQGGRLFFVMELAEGGNLAARLGGRPWAARPAAELVEALARAVQHAHEHGLVHRDLKPANIVLDGGGTPKVTDFGLVKDLDGPAGRTPSGAILGTPGYMAPEQAAGKAGRVGPAADVYALGALLYEALTGHPPFRGETALDTILLMLSGEPEPPSRLHPGVPRDLDAICLRCLRKAPGQRYPTAQALAEDLHRFLAGRRPAARSPGRRAAGWALLGGVAAASALGAIALATKLSPPLRTSGEEPRSLQSAPPVPAPVPPSPTSGRGRALAVGFTGEGALLCAGADGLIDVREAGTDKILRQFRGYAGEAGTAVISPDGRLVAMTGGDGRVVQLTDVVTGHSRLLTAQEGKVSCLAFSADGMVLASGTTGGTLCLWEVPTGSCVRDLGRPPVKVQCLAFSPDGDTLAGATPDDRIQLWEVGTGALRGILQGCPAGSLTMAFSPDGKTLAAAGEGRSVRLWELGAASPCGDIETPRGSVDRAFAPDGRTVAFLDGASNCYLHDLITGVGAGSFAPARRPVSCLGFSPDSGKLVLGMADGTTQVADGWWLTVPRSTPKRNVPAEELEAQWAALARPDAAGAFRALRSLVASPGQTVPFLAEHLQPVGRADVGRIRGLIADLGSGQQGDRDKARERLAELGVAAEGELRRAQRHPPAVDRPRTLQHLIEELLAPFEGRPRLFSRAIRVLEMAHTPGAKELVETLAQGAPGAPLTEEAKAALARWPGRPAAP